jgi:transcriptional regulator with XRE-family HTH domain
MASKTTEAPEHPEVAEDIIEAQRAHRLSDLKLAKAAGISPRHLREVKKGSNVSLRILKQLMAALQMPGIRFGNLMRGSGSLEGVSPEVLQMMAHAMKQAIAPVLELIEMLEAYGEGKSPAELDAKARELVRDAADDSTAANDRTETTRVQSSATKTKRTPKATNRR